jgi:hypothetical protein
LISYVRYCGEEINCHNCEGQSVTINLELENAGGSAAGSFSAHYSKIWGQVIVASEGQIASPQYPGTYPNDVEISWTVYGLGDIAYNSIKYEIIHFDIICDDNLELSYCDEDNGKLN